MMRSLLASVSLYGLAVVLWPVLNDSGVSSVSNPRPSITVPCEVIEWYDGDTGTVRVTLDMRVRLLNCWAPEVRSKDADEKRRGEAARDYVRQAFPAGSQAMLEVPLSGYSRLDDAITLGRVLGNVWVDGQSVSHEMVKAGHATTLDGGE